MRSVVAYLKTRGFKPGMGLRDLYSTINAGSPGHPYARDMNGSVLEHVIRMQRSEAARVRQFLSNPTETKSQSSQPATPVAPRYQDFIPSNIGAAMAANVTNNSHSSTVHHNNSAETHVGSVIVNTNATDASGIARDIKPAIERTSYAMVGNYSLA